MTLTPGTRLGPYEILAPLGAGGMGEVWRALDTRLAREVAIKSLPVAFAQDPERLARFEREAKLLASLSNPNVAGIFGLEEAGGTRFLVLELIDGETLEARIRRGPLPLGEVLDVARQVAAGVEAAHEAGVIHRDLKPGNVMITHADVVKVLDFGLAKGGNTRSASGSDPNLSASPTMTALAGTAMGVILGTAAYMSPEQARGRALDRRTDIWSFGCVVYEMLTGKRVYDGETVSDMVARILEREPDWSALPAGTPPRLVALLKRCLAKDAKQRLRDIGDARLELDAIVAGDRGDSAAAIAPAKNGPPAWAMAAGALALLAAGAAAAWFAAPRGGDDRAYALTITAPPGLAMGLQPTDLAPSPDGRQLLFVAADTLAGPRLWLRSLNALNARAFEGTENPSHPFWAPDGRHVGFFAGGKLKTLDIASGAVHVLADAPLPRGGTWGDGVILYQPASAGGLWKVPSDGGTAEIAALPDTTQGAGGLRFPQFLPDHRHFVCAIIGSRGPTMGFGALGEKLVRPISSDSTMDRPLFVRPDWLIYVCRSALRAQHLDLGSGRLTGAAVDVPGLQALVVSAGGSPVLSATNSGDLYQRATGDEATRLVIVDRRGSPLGSITGPDCNFRLGSVGPDGVHMVFECVIGGELNLEIWMADLRRGDMQPLLTDGSRQPLLSPDGRTLIFTPPISSNLRGLLTMRLDDPSSIRQVLQLSGSFMTPNSCTPDGSGVLMRIQGRETQQDLYLGHIAGPDSGKVEPVAATLSNEPVGAISPDGHWLAYISDESGRFECRVRRFPGASGATQVVSHGAWSDANGGRALGHPSWRRDGRELLYMARDGRSLMSVAVTPGDPPTFGEPQQVFRLPVTAREIVELPDHDKFVLALASDEVAHSSATVIVNWTKLLEKK